MWRYYIIGILCSVITGVLITTGLYIILVQGGLVLLREEPSVWEFIFIISGSLLALPGGFLAGFIRNLRDKKSGKSIKSPKSTWKIVFLGLALSLVSYFLIGGLAAFVLFAIWVDAIT